MRNSVLILLMLTLGVLIRAGAIRKYVTATFGNGRKALDNSDTGMDLASLQLYPDGA